MIIFIIIIIIIPTCRWRCGHQFMFSTKCKITLILFINIIYMVNNCCQNYFRFLSCQDRIDVSIVVQNKFNSIEEKSFRSLMNVLCVNQTCSIRRRSSTTGSDYIVDDWLWMNEWMNEWMNVKIDRANHVDDSFVHSFLNGSIWVELLPIKLELV